MYFLYKYLIVNVLLTNLQISKSAHQLPEASLKENNVLNLSFVLSKKNEVEDFTFDVGLIEKGNAALSPHAHVDSKGEEWNSCKTFSNKIQAQLWLNTLRSFLR